MKRFTQCVVFSLFTIMLISGYMPYWRTAITRVVYAEEDIEIKDLYIADETPLRIDSPEFPYDITHVLTARLLNLVDNLTDATGIMAMRAFQVAHFANLPALAELRHVDGRYSDNLLLSDEIMEIGFVYNQWNAPYSNFVLGRFGTGRSNGCGPIAVYNALFYLRGGHLILPNMSEDTPANIERNAARAEIAQNPASIIRFLEISGGVNGFGAAGTNPLVLVDYLRNAGYQAEISYLPRNLDSRIQESDVSIFLYSGGGLYIHYVMIRFSRETEMFYIYNWRGNASHARASVDSWVVENAGAGQRGYWPLAIITIGSRDAQ